MSMIKEVDLKKLVFPSTKARESIKDGWSLISPFLVFLYMMKNLPLAQTTTFYHLCKIIALACVPQLIRQCYVQCLKLLH